MEHKLRYDSKEQAINHLHSLGITDAEGKHDQTRLSLVWLAPKELEAPEYNAKGEIIKEGVYSSDVLVDILTNETFEFGAHEIEPNNKLHKFA